MKKLLLLLTVLCTYFISEAQFNPPNLITGSSGRISYNLGAISAAQGVMVSVMDTVANRATNYYGTLAVLPQDAGSAHPPLYMSNGVYWTLIGNGLNNIDTVYTERPIAVKFDSLGHQVIYLLINGLIDGGIVSFDSCNSLSVSAPTYNINYNQFNGLATSVHIDTSDAILNRIDRIVADTFNLVYVIKGTPASIALPPPFNPASQISLAEIQIPAGTTCLNSFVKIIYDENLGVPDEWDLTTEGTIAADPDNTDNPYHLTKAIFISSYVDSSQLVLTHTGFTDTVTSSSILKFYIYLNGLFNNIFTAQCFLNDTAVSNSLVLNSFMDVADSNVYQPGVSVPLNAFNWTGGSIFNKIVFTLYGWDTSGAKGFYLDYVQLQQGITPSAPSLKVDSTKIIAGNEYYYINGIAYLAGAVGGGGSAITLQTNGVDNGSQSILNLKQGSNVTIADDGVGGVTISSSAPGTGTVTSVGLTSTDITVGGSSSPITTSGTYTLAIVRTADQSITATAEQTVFNFSALPSSVNAMWIDINGDTIEPSFYSKATNAITFTSGVQLGAHVNVHFK